MLFINENSKKIRMLTSVTRQVNALEESVSAMTPEQMLAATADLRSALARGESSLDESLPMAYALVREAVKRVLGVRAYDVQIMGAVALHSGHVCEMATGEGKTIVAAFPAYLNALTGEGVHVVTVNGYLAARDSEQIGRVHAYLGLSTGLVSDGLAPNSEDRRREYAKDITYGTTSEFGFDYLRDNMVLRPGDKVQRGLSFAIVDEVDSILIDEARTPLIISSADQDAEDLYLRYAELVASFAQDDVRVFADKKVVNVSESGARMVEERFGLDNLYDGTNPRHIHHLSVAMYARFILENGVDYIVSGDEVLIVDEFTGRVLPGRRWSDGRHQAVEAKEGVPVVRESSTMATVSIQAYYKMYPKLAGMTGTAAAAAAEFFNVYDLPVVSIPPNRPCVRRDLKDRIYATYDAKINAVCDIVSQRRRSGQPVLIGTSSVEESEQISKVLSGMGEDHRVLNARDHSREASIIAQAGRWGEVTVATNMAGRGVDILLGGNVDFLTELSYSTWLKGTDTSSMSQEVLQDVHSQIRRQHADLCARDAEQIRDLGGLLVVGISKNTSQRIDRQLRGRAGRQGDPGETQFHVSLEDKLMQVYAKSGVADLLEKNSSSGLLEGVLATRLVDRAQNGAEVANSKVREDLVKYDAVFVDQRLEVYRNRDSVLSASAAEMLSLTETCLGTFFDLLVSTEDMPQVDDGFAASIGVDFTGYGELRDNVWDEEDMRREKERAVAAALLKLGGVPASEVTEVQRATYLSTLDGLWRQHLGDLAHLREGIHLRALGQKDPLGEWQKEAYHLFADFGSAVHVHYVRSLFTVLFPAKTPPLT